MVASLHATPRFSDHGTAFRHHILMILVNIVRQRAASSGTMNRFILSKSKTPFLPRQKKKARE
jgi:hypothetical protein